MTNLGDMGKTNFLLLEILKWIKFSGIKNVKEVVSSILNTDLKLKIYELSDGQLSNSEIVKITNLNERTVRRYWENWSKANIKRLDRVNGRERYFREFDLDDMGIEVPEVNSDSSIKTEVD